MDHSDRVSLLTDGVPSQSRTWAEFGSGSGAFTLALAELIDSDGIIYSIDKNTTALEQQKQEIQRHFPRLEVHYVATDFSKPLDLPQLDGILMANALHFLKDKRDFLLKIKNYLKPEGRLLVVEYNIDRGNPWVPYPISFTSWEKLATQCGFAETRLLATLPSRYHREIYSAVAELNEEREKG